MSASRLLLVYSVILTLCLPAKGFAAEFSILSNSPLKTECWMQTLTGTIYPGSFVRGQIPPCSDDDRNYGAFTDKATLVEQGRWQFWNPETNRPELRLDGAWSYDEIHDVAAVGSLINSPVLLLEGPIEAGDAERFEAFLETNGFLDCLTDDYCPFQNVLALDSPGGNLAEALKIAEIVHRYNFPVLIPKDAICASACSFVFFAGYTEFEGFHHSRRFVHETGRLMVHRPRITLNKEVFSSDEVQRYLQLSDEVKEEAVRQFLAARIPRLVLLSMYETPTDTLATVPLPLLTSFATVIGSTQLMDGQPSRSGVLSFCAYQYHSQNERMNDDLLTNLEVRRDTFVTRVDRDGFLCYGARLPDKGWFFDVCTGASSACHFSNFAQWGPSDTEFQLDAEFETYGALLGGYTGKARHDALSRAIRWSDPGVEALPRWVADSMAPRSFCGELDTGAPDSVAAIQSALNALGYDAGPVDGMMGGRTETALSQAAATLGQDYGDTIDARLLKAIGVSDAQVAAMRLCPG